MIFRKLLPVAAFMISISSFAQIRTGVYFSSDKKYKEIIEELGNPLEGNPVMIVTSFVPNHGSYVWYLNEKKVEKGTYFNGIPKDLHSGIYGGSVYVFLILFNYLIIINKQIFYIN